MQFFFIIFYVSFTILELHYYILRCINNVVLPNKYSFVHSFKSVPRKQREVGQHQGRVGRLPRPVWSSPWRRCPVGERSMLALTQQLINQIKSIYSPPIQLINQTKFIYTWLSQIEFFYVLRFRENGGHFGFYGTCQGTCNFIKPLIQVQWKAAHT